MDVYLRAAIAIGVNNDFAFPRSPFHMHSHCLSSVGKVLQFTVSASIRLMSYSDHRLHMSFLLMEIEV